MTIDPLINLTNEEARATVLALQSEFVVDAATQWRFERARLDAVRVVAAAREKLAAKEASAAIDAHVRASGGSYFARERANARALFAEGRLKKASAATQAATDALMAHYDAERNVA